MPSSLWNIVASLKLSFKGNCLVDLFLVMFCYGASLEITSTVCRCRGHNSSPALHALDFEMPLEFDLTGRNSMPYKSFWVKLRAEFSFCFICLLILAVYYFLTLIPYPKGQSMGQSEFLQSYEFSASESKHCFVNLSNVLRTVSGVEGWEGDPISKKEEEYFKFCMCWKIVSCCAD